MIEGRTTSFTPRPCLQGSGRGGVNKAPYVRAVANKHGILSREEPRRGDKTTGRGGAKRNP